MRTLVFLLALLAPGLPAVGLGADCDDRAAALEVHLGALEAAERRPAALGPALDQVAAWLATCRNHPLAPALTYRAGRLAYKLEAYDRAVEFLDAVATGWPARIEAINAAHLVLDIHNQRGDLDGLARAVERYLATEDLGHADPRGLADLQRIGMQVEFKLAGRGALEDPEGAFQRYQRFVNRYPASKLADEALFNAAVMAEKAGRRESARLFHRRLVEAYPLSPLVDRSLWVLAQTHLLLAEPEKAAACLERLAAGTGPHAEDARFNLNILHRALGDRSAAPVVDTPDIARARRRLLMAPHEQANHLALARALLAAGQPGLARLVASQGLALGHDAGLVEVLDQANRALGDP